MYVYYFAANGVEQCMDIASCYAAPDVGTVVSIHVGHGCVRDYRVEAKDESCVFFVAVPLEQDQSWQRMWQKVYADCN